MKNDGLAWKARTSIEIQSSIHHSSLVSFRPLLMSNIISSIVKKSNKNENDVSCIKCPRHVQLPEDNRHTGVSVIGVIVALIHMIPRVLKIFDPTKFPTHISYLFFKIAVMVVANSGKLVPAAIIVAQIARCDIQKISAMYTAEFTTTSEDNTSSHRLAINLLMFNSIHFDHFFLHIRIDNISNTTKIPQNIPLNVDSPNDTPNVAGSDHISIFSTESMITHANK